MKALNKLTIRETLQALKDKKFSSCELLESHIKAVEANRDLNAFITETLDLAKEKAKESDLKYLNGEARALEGIPVSVKDVFCTKDVRTTAASKILSNFTPPYESTITTNLFGKGVVMLGKTNLDEFAMGVTNHYSAFGPAINPWKETGSKENLVPGGSSGGSAITVAAHMSMGALGTDTGGSVRQPASFCGIVGFKPSYGRCSRYGIVAFASSLDQAGVFARSVDDAALLSTAIMGYDNKDATCSKEELPNLESAMDQGLKGMKIGIPKEYHGAGLDPEIEALWANAKEMLRKEGAEIVDVTLPHTKYGVAAYYVIAPAEASSNLARYDGVRYGLREYKEGMSLDEMYEATRTEGFGHEVERRIMIGTYVLSSGFYDAYFSQAQRVRKLMVTDFKLAFDKVDALLTPVTINTAFALTDKKQMDPIALYLNDVFTIPASMAGLPAMSIPAKLNGKGLPIGLQVIANRFREDNVFRVAKNLERCLNFKVSPKGY
jgi:aspartyl-tRNA(Asn)/glutamyl-tRNA(Gln) amidotransferase subunit A